MNPQPRRRPRMGVYDRPYWAFVQDRELRLQKCAACGQFRYPPGPICPKCLSPRCDWVALSGRGRVVTWTVFRRQYLPEFPIPYTVVSVETAEGPLLIGNLINPGASQIEIGLPVRAAFEEFETEEGPWRICQWEADPGLSLTETELSKERPE